MWSLAAIPYAFTVWLALLRHQAKTWTTETMTQATMTWTTYRAYVGLAIAARPPAIWVSSWLTAAMCRAIRWTLTIIGTNNRQQLNAKHRAPHSTHASALRRF